MKAVNASGYALVTGVGGGGGGGATFSGGISTGGNTLGDTGMVTNRLVLAGGNNVTLSGSVNGGSATITFSAANQSVQTGGVYAVGNTTGESSSSTYDLRTLSVDLAGIVSGGWSNGSLRVSATQSNQAFSAAGGSSAFQTLSFNNANGATFSNVGGAVQISYTVPSITNSSWTASDAATSLTIAQLAFTNANGVTLTLSTTTGGSATLVGSHNALTSQSNQAFSAAGGSSAFQTLSFSDNVNASWTNNAGQVALTSLRGSFFATSNTTQSSSGSINLNSIIFNGAGVASVGISNGSIIVSVPAGGGAGDGGVFAGISNFGNTAGSTGTVSTGPFVLVGSNGITLSQSTGAAGASGTVTIARELLSEWQPYANLVLVTQSFPQANLYFNHVNLPAVVQFDHAPVKIFFSNATNSSGSGTLSVLIGAYTRTSNSLSLLHSTSFSTAITNSGTVGSYSLYSQVRNLPIPWTSTFQPGNYWLAVAARSTTAGANMTFSKVGLSIANSNANGWFGGATNQTNQNFPGNGVYSQTTTALPGSVAMGEIFGNVSQHQRAWALFFVSQTV